jgi:arabinogalactan oligomer / maltooligosaccharide transport system substrate-binding protein
VQKRAYGPAVLAGLVALLLSACADGSSPPLVSAVPGASNTAAAPGATGVAPPPATPQVTGAPVRDAKADLVLWCGNDVKPVLDAYAAQFGREQGISVAVQAFVDLDPAVESDVMEAMAGGRGPDVLVGRHDRLGELVEDGAVAPVALSGEQQGAFTAPALRAVSYGGKLYGVPYATESLALLRNTALAPDPPASYEDLLANGSKLVAEGKATNVLLQPVGRTGDAYSTYPYLKAFGGGLFGVKDNGDFDTTKVLVDSVGSVKGMSFLGRLGNDRILSTEVDAHLASSLFATGRAPYFVTGPSVLPAAKQAGIRYAVSPLPTLAGNKVTPLLEVQMFYVSSRAKNDAFAQEFVTTYATRPEMQVALSQAGQRPPALSSALDAAAASDPDVKAWSAAGQGALPAPNIPAMSRVWRLLGQAEADVVDQQATAAERLKAAQTEIVAAVQSAG